jgi:diaminohydroxyphosphoribosylaminopyrimidine deaminase/5-amino-6-(5-phosphoribosylamino)uracil reductase
VVLDSQGRLPLDCILVRTARMEPTLVTTTRAIAPAHHQELEALGCEVLVLPAEGGRLTLPLLLEELGRRRLTNVLIEGGGEVLGSFRDLGAIDEVHVFIAPRLIGGAGASVPFTGRGTERISEAPPLAEHTVEVIDGDVYVHGFVARATISHSPQQARSE